MKDKLRLETTSASLHVMAMLFMLCDHIWGVVLSGNDWLTCIGRLAFPIFAFMIVEGYFRTKNLRKYVSRLLIFAVLSEIPFNLAIGGGLFYPMHQNVLWSFLISIGLMHLNEKAKTNGKLFIRIAVAVGTVLLGTIAGLVTMVDYLHFGILTVLVFYFFRGRKWWCFLGQLLCLWVINIEMMGGLGWDVSLLGLDFFLPSQAFAIFALIPIWLYRGKQGVHNKFLQYTYYAFYPVHLLVLKLIHVILSA